jgi:pyrimidine-nucleoside phosphorylase
VALGSKRFKEVVMACGCAVVGQTANLVPADKKLYALRDVTATINSIPLIASSIMSKKIAAGPQCILFDVKCGSGAFMKDVESAIKLAQAMVAIGEEVGRRTVALITDMDRPLGNNVGNALEVMEACDVLKGVAPEDITETCVELATQMLVLAGRGDSASCRGLVREQIANGAGLAKLCEMIAAQGGDAQTLLDYTRFAQATCVREVRARQAGWVVGMNAEGVGVAACELGAGRERIEDAIDPAAGILLARKTGDRVEEGDLLATLYSSSEGRLDEGEWLLRDAYRWGDQPAPRKPHFLARVTAEGVEELV